LGLPPFGWDMDRESVRQIISEILDERLVQNEKWGEQNHDDSLWACILMEEVGETTQAIFDLTCYIPGTVSYDTEKGKTREELIQVAAVAIAWLECIDRRDK